MNIKKYLIVSYFKYLTKQYYSNFIDFFFKLIIKSYDCKIDKCQGFKQIVRF